VSSLRWNHCPVWHGISVQVGLEYAFDEANFGKCKDYYIHEYRDGVTITTVGGLIFDYTLQYLFPQNEFSKKMASEDVKERLAQFEHNARTGSYQGNSKCTDWKNYEARLKEILNTVIQAAPEILQAKKNMVAIAQASEAKEKADGQAKILAERKKNEERSNKLKVCQNTNEYKLYETSTAIVNGQQTINNAEQTIQREKDGSKISGYVNKQLMYQMGNLISMTSRQNDENFDKYKKLGGSAWRIGSVKAIPNPCNF